MKIYFCGSIRGGRQDAELYARLIGELKNYGEVLTEHVGSSALTEFGGDGSNEYIWKRDTDWLRESDVVVAECTTTSIGVGYELAFAEALGKRVVVLYRGDPGRLSAMVAGDPNFEIHYYQGEGEFPGLVKEIFA